MGCKTNTAEVTKFLHDLWEMHVFEMTELAKIAYDAYSESTGGVSAVTGDKLPEFHETPDAVQQAWIAAVDAVWQKVMAD